LNSAREEFDLDKREEISLISMFAFKITAVEETDAIVMLAGEDLKAARIAGEWILKQMLNKSNAGRGNKGKTKTFKPRKPYDQLSPSGKWRRDQKEKNE
jgi:hypothetical protein